jgi:hypothetical protein
MPLNRYSTVSEILETVDTQHTQSEKTEWWIGQHVEGQVWKMWF